jgi:hypothetical protein
MKKLALFVMLPALAIFMVPVMASAEEDRAINGMYAMSASGSCLHSEMPYYQDVQTGRWTVPHGSQVYAGVTVAKGKWTFVRTDENQGTGTWSHTLYATILPGGHVPVPVIPVEVRVFQQGGPFTYVTTPSGEITVTLANGIPLTGSISIDENAMTLLSANVVQPNLSAPFWNTICNMERTLIKVSP